MIPEMSTAPMSAEFRFLLDRATHAFWLRFYREHDQKNAGELLRAEYERLLREMPEPKAAHMEAT